MKTLMALLLVPLAGIGVQGCLCAEAELSTLEVTHENLSFQSVPSEIAGCGELFVGATYTFPTQAFSLPNVADVLPHGTKASVSLYEVVLRAHDQATALDYLQALTLTFSSPTQTNGAPQTLLDYSNDGPLQDSRTELVLPASGASLEFDSMHIDSYIFSLTVSSLCDDLPRNDLTIDITMKLSGSAEFKY